jgi:hypothetical protein
VEVCRRFCAYLELVSLDSAFFGSEISFREKLNICFMAFKVIKSKE